MTLASCIIGKNTWMARASCLEDEFQQLAEQVNFFAQQSTDLGINLSNIEQAISMCSMGGMGMMQQGLFPAMLMGAQGGQQNQQQQNALQQLIPLMQQQNANKQQQIIPLMIQKMMLQMQVKQTQRQELSLKQRQSKIEVQLRLARQEEENFGKLQEGAEKGFALRV